MHHPMLLLLLGMLVMLALLLVVLVLRETPVATDFTVLTQSYVSFHRGILPPPPLGCVPVQGRA